MGALQLEDLPKYTYEDYCLWEGKWELIDGIVYAMSPMPMIEHQSISSKIARYLDEALQGCKKCRALLPVDWKIDDSTIVQPDNLVICYPAKGAYITKAPTIIFEILSKSTATKDKGVKFRLYEAEGVKYYIIVDPLEKLAKVYELHEGKYIKVVDATTETTTFSLAECSFDFDFSKIFVSH
ncbi:MAG: Uma2 family endonuclease [Campylobacterales bacterium]|nr:Uma2 family endonuclease [Campylobacterales bacterium]